MGGVVEQKVILHTAVQAARGSIKSQLTKVVGPMYDCSHRERQSTTQPAARSLLIQQRDPHGDSRCGQVSPKLSCGGHLPLLSSFQNTSQLISHEIEQGSDLDLQWVSDVEEEKNETIVDLDSGEIGLVTHSV